MKVKCIDNHGIEDLITVGKTYEVIEEDKYKYKIINNRYWYYKDRFKPLSEIRNETINKLLEE